MIVIVKTQLFILILKSKWVKIISKVAFIFFFAYALSNMQHQTFKRFLADIGVTIIMCSKEENIKQRTNLEVNILLKQPLFVKNDLEMLLWT